jgi:hypothetical protein
MTGSVALDVVIGLVFIFLLYSLFATVICEIVAVQLGLRERNLRQAIRRMLEDFPETSENKIVAFFRHLGQSVMEIFRNYHGPATCVFYHLPIIKYFARNTLQSKPAYITRQNFSKAMLEIFRRYGGGDDLSDLEKIRNVLQGKLEHTKDFKSLKNIILINPATGKAYAPGEKIDFSAVHTLLQSQAASISADQSELDIAQRIILKRILKVLRAAKKDDAKKAAVIQVDEILNLFGRETRSHLLSLLKDANDDLFKFRLHLEQWFDDTMDRASGWYKQKVQFTLFIIGLIIAIWFNANTLVIVDKLSSNTELREKMVENGVRAVNDPKTRLVVDQIRKNGKDSVEQVDSIKTNQLNQQAKLDSLSVLRRDIARELDDTNSLLGMGWLDLPDSLPLVRWSPAAEVKLARLEERRLVDYAVIYLNDTTCKMLLEFPRGATPKILNRLKALKIKASMGEPVYTGANKTETRIDVDHSWCGQFWYLMDNIFSVAIFGYMLTAIAISLGAPFWFDLLNKLVQIRGALKTPTQTQGGSDAGDKSLSDPSHPANRKG